MEESILHRKHRIILTAIDIINECGIQGLSTREIAKCQGISEATIFKHYKTKNDLILSVLDYFSMFDNEIIETTRIRRMGPKSAIIYFMSKYSEYYENYPAITAISEAYHILVHDPELEVKVKSIFSTHNEFIKEKVLEARENEELNSEVNCEQLADVIIGSFKNACLKWRFNNRDFSIKEYTLSSLNMILKAFEK